jgi:GT2 family glycosyltransferase
MDISVCVAVYKAHDAPNLRTLHAALPQALPGLEWELAVALNGISPEDAEVPDGAVVARLPVNRGVAAGWNAAGAAASGKLLLFVNDDVLPAPGSLRVLHDAMNDGDDAGVAGPEGSRWDIAAGHHVEWVSAKGLAPGEKRECDVVSGHLFATPRSLFEQLDGFDDAYNPCSFEDIDYSTKVRLEAGRRCFVVGGVEAEHEVGISIQRPWRRVAYDGRSESLFSIWRRNRRHLRRKWGDAAGARADG